MNIGILVIATNSYFPLGIRFIKQFNFFYRGNANIKYYFVSDKSPNDFIPESLNVHYISDFHKSWKEGTDSKFKNILKTQGDSLDYIYYFDADTVIRKPFTNDWFLGDLVGGKHFMHNVRLKAGQPLGFERRKHSKAYVPLDTNLPQIYYYGAFFGGKHQNVIYFSKEIIQMMEDDIQNNFLRAVQNDESYINAYFHYNPPSRCVESEFAFGVSNKGSIPKLRHINNEYIQEIEQDLLKYKNSCIDIINGKVVEIK